MNKNLCYIIVVTYNSSNTIIQCLDSLFLLDNNRYKIIVVDNNSIDDTIHLINYNFEKKLDVGKLSIIENSKNHGYAYAANKAMKYALGFNECEYFWILNSDVKVSKNCLDELFENVNSDNIVSPAIYDYFDKNKIQSRGCSVNSYFLTTANIIDNQNKNIDYLSGVSLFLNKLIIDKIGYLSIDYFMYYEDVEWCHRALKNNLKLKIIDNAFVFHKQNIYIPLNLKIKSQINRIKFSIDHFVFKLPVVAVSVFMSIFLTIIRRFIFFINEKNN